MRLGSSTRMSPRMVESRAGGTRVVFPAPGGASITRLGALRSESITPGRMRSMGRPVNGVIETRCRPLRQPFVRKRGADTRVCNVETRLDARSFYQRCRCVGLQELQQRRVEYI